MICRLLRGWVAGLVAAGFGLYALPAAANGTTLTYVGYLAGLPVMTVTATISLPAGLKPAQGGYTVNAEVGTTGTFAALYPYHMSIAAQGRLAQSRTQPKQFRSVGRIYQRQESVTLNYAPDGRVDITAAPLTRQAQEAVQTGVANGTIDPASLVVAVVASYASRQTCTGKFKLFDGVRRYNVRVAQTGFVDLAPLQQSYYDGAATECQATPELIQGFSNMAQNSQFYPQSARIWLAPAIQGLPAIPVRIEAQNALGPMLLDLVAVH
jgi:hypothetical protein